MFIGNTMRVVAFVILMLLPQISGAKSVISKDLCSDFVLAVDQGDSELIGYYHEFMEGYFAGASIETSNEKIVTQILDGSPLYRNAIVESCRQFPNDSFGHVVRTIYSTMAR